MLAVALALRAAPLALCLVLLGSDSLPVRQYLFFSGAALVTLGGAYAVLAYVTRPRSFRSPGFTPAQAIDDLSLAEATPGPLIMVLQFVGFMTGSGLVVRPSHRKTRARHLSGQGCSAGASLGFATNRSMITRALTLFTPYVGLAPVPGGLSLSNAAQVAYHQAERYCGWIAASGAACVI